MIKLNVGCGSKPKEGYVNIDIISPKADVQAKCTDLPYSWLSIDTIESYHLIEHMDRLEAVRALEHWYNLLKVGGTLVLECPDIEGVMREYLKGNDEMLFSVYGRNRYDYDTHLWGYSRRSMETLLLDIGFSEIVIMNGTDYHSKFEPCMRVEAIR